MPWHDVAISFGGEAARDVARHFIHRWNFVKASKASGKEVVPFLLPVGEYDHMRDEQEFVGTCTIQILRSCSEWSNGIPVEVITAETIKCSVLYKMPILS